MDIMQFEDPTHKLGREVHFHDDVISLAFIIKFFFLIHLVGGGVQAGSTRHVGH
jgi:hypothetical protein